MGSIEDSIHHVDVLIVGGGPVGLITAYQLARTLPSIMIIEKHAKSAQDQYGRAITLFPRTSEMLDQLGLADKLAQHCFACRETVSYDALGNEVHARGWAFMEQMKDTAWDFALVLRQKYQEEIFRRALRELGVELHAPATLVGLHIDESIPPGGYRVSATVEHVGVVKCKYLIGADGGRSTVRRLLDIPFDGSSTDDRWVRIDGHVSTNLPKPRSYCAIESPTHGNVLWAALDHGATRIGYAFTLEREKRYPVFDQAAAIAEAVAAVKPFDLSFTTVDWWTIYAVGQRVARRFFTNECVFLAGDSCHTHSSGAAQGMNTGIHDAVNLAWKLSLVLRGLAHPKLLRTYEAERRPNVEKLIAYDRDIARLMTMQLPDGWTGDPAADPNIVLGQVMADAASFSSGLGISYEPDGLLNVVSPQHPPSPAPTTTPGHPHPGHRAPDVPLRKPGTLEPTRLHRETPNAATFYVLIFVGDSTATCTTTTTTTTTPPPPPSPSPYHAFCTALDRSPLFFPPHPTNQSGSNATAPPTSFLTILPRAGPSPWELLGGRGPPGDQILGVSSSSSSSKVLFDSADMAAHKRYVDGGGTSGGAVYVLRPDGWVGTVVGLGAEGVAVLEGYFGGLAHG
ncbi:pentachlorophenol 4-monooxygenase [Diplodia corticola]|uniref:Pentachlorophenol 4-monooxygenase n=1 Tax=Diplodia corticola TaxID=236234 RepID=A0A1J9QMA4_9PEZI|nr:pentachlorophenol 4-monooxygenase [Diplodia corticola]OJD30022.1 pentachlorophenol 4-monooxygenase [Diplodia corticola]